MPNSSSTPDYWNLHMTVITEEKEPGTRIIEGLAPHCMVLMHARMKMNQQHCLRQQLAYRSLFPPAVCLKAATASFLETKLVESLHVDISQANSLLPEKCWLCGNYYFPEIGKSSNETDSAWEFSQLDGNNDWVSNESNSKATQLFSLKNLSVRFIMKKRAVSVYLRRWNTHTFRLI